MNCVTMFSSEEGWRCRCSAQFKFQPAGAAMGWCVCYINVQLLVCLLSWACGWRRVGVASFSPWSQPNKIIQIFAQSQPDREKGEESERESKAFCSLSHSSSFFSLYLHRNKEDCLLHAMWTEQNQIRAAAARAVNFLPRVRYSSI